MAWVTNATRNKAEGRCEKAPASSNSPYLEVLANSTYQSTIAGSKEQKELGRTDNENDG